ncbi:beta-lactamase [Flavobacterium akiainvivens]|uniref:Beta-lactamase n=1 Tax=Flavobacterium akiainvivens TaxID=1202724 RepID=A0A0M9VIW6_9FLAO|nr:serine hydrolase [Flavobacterium akiainvivens]KOS07129.1 beta-lactamase [Flavobacterium akiainvivens]SFQ75907.1 CubicO group peptidase, beta-lactamase class C family [Flavobacterium akiainvivens]
MKKFLLWLVGIIAVIVALLYIFDVDYLIKAVRVVYLHGKTTAYLDDYTHFENRTVKNGPAQPWPQAKDYNTVDGTQRLESVHKELGTVAYLIIKNDSIWHESYYDGYGPDSKSNSFSMAKSVVSAALFKAIEEGKIKSLDQKVSDFYPEYKTGFGARLTVGDLSSMATGMDWGEQYSSAFSVTTRAYFGDNLAQTVLDVPIVYEPGQKFEYVSGATELLAMVLTKATGQTLSDYVSDKFWKPMGADHEALWQLDKADGLEKAYCCLGSNARDFARFGKLFLHNGEWNGTKILDSLDVQKMVTPRFATSPQYGYGWWINIYNNKKMYYMRGHLGQFVIVVPEDKLIIVRLGHTKGLQTTTDPHSNDFYVYVDEAYKMLGLMAPTEGRGNGLQMTAP